MEKEMQLESMSIEELNALITRAQEVIASRSEKKYKVHLYADKYKGSGKCWVARVDDHGKVLGFVEPHAVIPDRYRQEKIYFLGDGDYLLCETGTKTYDDKKYITVRDGKKI
jgi:hypothetical protein